jgi:tetratricopeptide (TPR) repeat protein
MYCPGYAPAHYNKGVLHSEARQWQDALQQYQRTVELSPRYAQAHCNMGVIYKELGQLEEAVAAYEMALQVGFRV